jgi:DNA-directed RNA polymerase sigma subunit (sigma70/sigma32)
MKPKRKKARVEDRARTCEEVARLLGTSRENVFQIERNALAKLRRSAVLREFVDGLAEEVAS